MHTHVYVAKCKWNVHIQSDSALVIWDAWGKQKEILRLEEAEYGDLSIFKLIEHLSKTKESFLANFNNVTESCKASDAELTLLMWISCVVAGKHWLSRDLWSCKWEWHGKPISATRGKTHNASKAKNVYVIICPNSCRSLSSNSLCRSIMCWWRKTQMMEINTASENRKLSWTL